MTDHLYRVRITSYPKGSHVLEQECLPEDRDWYWVQVSDWSPPGWTPSHRYGSTVGGTRFSWPSDYTVYRTRAAALRRARLLESFGAEVVIQTSSEINWPPPPPFKVRPGDLIEVSQ